MKPHWLLRDVGGEAGKANEVLRRSRSLPGAEQLTLDFRLVARSRMLRPADRLVHGQRDLFIPRLCLPAPAGRAKGTL